jgi:hypothetical protein
MRPINKNARILLDNELRVRGLCDAADLSRALEVSLPTLHRIIRERELDIVRIGTTKNARYGLRRTLRGKLESIPVYAIDSNGRGKQLASMDLATSQGAVLDIRAMGWPVSNETNTWWDGLPYPLMDMRPQGFLGRILARQIAQDFNVSDNPEEWSDDDVIYILTVRGSDNQGNLIIGEAAYRDFLQSVAQPPVAISEGDLKSKYAELARSATQFGGGGSSAGGEFPKFTAKRALKEASNPYVIVKFSGADNSASVRRWSDLLICEHLALEAIRKSSSLLAPLSRIIQHEGRTFLEVERFDRIGEFGRLATTSLASLDNAFVGMGNGSWVEASRRLVRAKVLPPNPINNISILWWFGKLIANTDMHFGNLTFLIEPEVTLSPAYDMLPMLYAPLAGGEVPDRQFQATLPMPSEQDEWDKAFAMALEFWDKASTDSRITNNFKHICKSNHDMLSELNKRLKIIA